MIYAGQGVHYAKAWDELVALAEAGTFQSPPVLRVRAPFRKTILCPWAAVAGPIRR